MNFGKRFIASSTALILALALVVSGCSKPATEQTPAEPQNEQTAEDTWEGIKKEGKMIVGLDDAFAPFGFRNDKNELVGFDIDLGDALAKRLGIEIEWQPAEWSGVVMSLKTGKFDAIWSGMSITPKREAEVDFTTPYIGSAQVIVVTSDNTNIKGKEDLTGKTVGTQLGSTGEVACKKLEGLKNLKTYDIYTEALNDLKTGRLNAVVTDDVTARYYFKQQPDAFIILDDVLSYEPMGIAIRKGDNNFREVLNKEIEGMIDDGTYKTISEKWFGEDMSQFLNN